MSSGGLLGPTKGALPLGPLAHPMGGPKGALPLGPKGPGEQKPSPVRGERGTTGNWAKY
jgi:hypothetical protein